METFEFAIELKTKEITLNNLAEALKEQETTSNTYEHYKKLVTPIIEEAYQTKYKAIYKQVEPLANAIRKCINIEKQDSVCWNGGIRASIHSHNVVLNVSENGYYIYIETKSHLVKIYREYDGNIYTSENLADSSILNNWNRYRVFNALEEATIERVKKTTKEIRDKQSKMENIAYNLLNDN